MEEKFNFKPPNNKKPTYYGDWVHFGEEIGKGGFAKVYLGYERKTGKKGAIKHIIKGENEKYIKLEINILSKLRNVKNKYITKLYAFVEMDTEIVFILEYCDGGTLSDYLKEKGRLSEMETKKFMRQIASALLCLRTQKGSLLFFFFNLFKFFISTKKKK